MLYMKERICLVPSEWYYRTDSLIMHLDCYKYSFEGEEIPPSIRELRTEKLRTKFCEAALCPRSCGDALWCALLWAQHRFSLILKLLEVPRGGRVPQLPALPHVGCGCSLCPNHWINLLRWRLFCYKTPSGISAGKDLFRLPSVLNNEINVTDLISCWCISYSRHMSCF